jgi:hypothetical protein
MSTPLLKQPPSLQVVCSVVAFFSCVLGALLLYRRRRAEPAKQKGPCKPAVEASDVPSADSRISAGDAMRNPKPETEDPKSEIRNPKPETRILKPKTRDPEPYILHSPYNWKP